MENWRFCPSGIFGHAIPSSPHAYLAAGFTFYRRLQRAGG